MDFVSDCWSLIGRGSYIKQSSSGDNGFFSHNHNPSTYICILLRQPGNEHGCGTTIDISPHSVEIPNPTDRPILIWL